MLQIVLNLVFTSEYAVYLELCYSFSTQCMEYQKLYAQYDAEKLKQMVEFCTITYSYIDYVSKKQYHPTTNKILTITVRFQLWVNMSSNSGLNSHFICLVYLPYVAKLLDHKNHEFSLKLHTY